MEDIKESGKLIILTQNTPTVYFYDSNEQPKGFEYEMAEAFAKELGVKTEYKVLQTVHQILTALEKGEGDLASAGLTKTAVRSSRFLFGPAYQKVRQQIVCHKGIKKSDKLGDFTGLRITVPKHSSYEENLANLNKKSPNLSWQSAEDANTEDLLEKITGKEIDCTVLDSNIADINRRYFPELIVAFEFSKVDPLAWVLGPDSKELKKALDKWFPSFQAGGEFEQIRERYYGYVKEFDYVDIRAFHRSVEKKYPNYQEMFESAAQKNGLDANLLAAQSYQESHWNPKAKSPTGVRGIMMLTLPTAKSLGVKSRLDPKENIFAGAKYFSKLMKSFSDEVKQPDRSWLALASYNVGRGHMHDAQTLARRLHKNPYLWSDIREALPLLSNKKYYKKLKYGYARGREPVKYVQRIRDYKNILDMKLSQENQFNNDKDEL